MRGFEIALPGPGTTAAQIALSSLDWALAAGVFYALLPAAPGLSFAHVLGAFLLAQVVGVVSHVPAGLGVFETMMVLLLAPWLPGDAVLGSALAYRLVYYLLPLVVAVVLFAGFELRERRELLRRASGALAQWAPELVPRVLTIATFAAGVVLLLSSATPAAGGRIELIERVLPLPVLEASHFLASLVGVALLLLARAIQQRVDAGYALTLGMLAAGAVFSLLKGFDWEEATLLSAMFLALLPCRRFFYRRSSLLSQSFTPGWMTGILLALIGTAFVVLLAYRHVEYSHDLWWQFELEAHAPRSLRALVGGAGLLAFFALARLLRAARPELPAPTPADLERALPIVRRASRSSAHLALLGDKQLLFHESGAGFVMYGVSGRSWVAMGDPVGAPELRRELAWRFHELADAHRGLTVFYEVGAEDLPIYLDLGLSLRKLGEEARVRVSDFSLEGGARKGLRQTERGMEREGASFEVLPAEAVPALLDELARSPTPGSQSKNTREKRFSLGCFDRAYLARTPLAVVRRHGRIVAFANVWAPDAREEFSLDLMRYDDDAPSGVMEFLFTELLLWGQKQGYGWFSLGMAPLSGLRAPPPRAALEPARRAALPPRRELLQLPRAARVQGEVRSGLGAALPRVAGRPRAAARPDADLVADLRRRHGRGPEVKAVGARTEAAHRPLFGRRRLRHLDLGGLLPARSAAIVHGDLVAHVQRRERGRSRGRHDLRILRNRQRQQALAPVRLLDHDALLGRVDLLDHAFRLLAGLRERRDGGCRDPDREATDQDRSEPLHDALLCWVVPAPNALIVGHQRRLGSAPGDEAVRPPVV